MYCKSTILFKEKYQIQTSKSLLPKMFDFDRMNDQFKKKVLSSPTEYHLIIHQYIFRQLHALQCKNYSDFLECLLYKQIQIAADSHHMLFIIVICLILMYPCYYIFLNITKT